MTLPPLKSAASPKRLAGVVFGVALTACGGAGSPGVATHADAGTRKIGEPETGSPQVDAGGADASPDVLDATFGTGGGPPPPCSETPAQRPDGGTCVLEAE